MENNFRWEIRNEKEKMKQSFGCTLMMVMSRNPVKKKTGAI